MAHWGVGWAQATGKRQGSINRVSEGAEGEPTDRFASSGAHRALRRAFDLVA